MKKLLIVALALALTVMPCLTLAASLPHIDLSGTIQWDLTRLGYTMAYAQMYDMLTNPANYVGQTLKLRGTYYGPQPEGADEPYHLILVKDETACCEIGMEFVVTGDTSALTFPKEDAPIELTGLISTIEVEGNTYPVLFVNEVVELPQE